MVFRRLSDLLQEVQYAEVQLRLLADSGPHHIRAIGLQISSIHRRLAQLEGCLRAKARSLGEDDQLDMTTLLHRLQQRTDRRLGRSSAYQGPERRRLRLQDRRLNPSAGFAVFVEDVHELGCLDPALAPF